MVACIVGAVMLSADLPGIIMIATHTGWIACFNQARVTVEFLLMQAKMRSCTMRHRFRQMV